MLDSGPGSTSWLFREMTTLRPHHTKRVSSWDRSGKNRDFVTLESGSTALLADIVGPGCINHFYAAVSSLDRLYLRKLVLRFYWDDEEKPSVEVPYGDFFGVTNGKLRYFTSLMLCVNPGGFGPNACDGFSTYFPMPFAKSARITITNEQEEPVRALWYHVNYETFDSLDPSLGRFHAQWRRENLTEAGPQPTTGRWQGANLTGQDNYVIFEAEGQGNFAGLVLGVDNVQGGWWGEGDDMIFIDGEEWPPSIHGTGTEEVFGGGACPNDEYAGPYHGFHLISDELWSGKTGMYRFYVHDPIRFQRSIRVTIEHGHNNDCCNDYSSVAFWYQSEPHQPFPPLRPVAERLPRLPEVYYQLVARERALSQRISGFVEKRSMQESHRIRIQVTKPILRAIWAEEWELAAELLDKADVRLAELESN